MPVACLSLREREEIRAGIERGETNREISELLGRHRCTIYREIRRNGGRARYLAAIAHDRACRERKRPRIPKLESDPQLFAHVSSRLRERDSPMTISIELARGVWGITALVSHETIYQAIYAGTFGKIRTPHVKRRRRKHRHQPTSGGHSLGQFRPIHDRPSSADRRQHVGHLEGDLIVGAYNQSALITLIDRKTRMCWLGPVASKKATDLTVGLTHLLAKLPTVAKTTLTWDQGAEIAQWQHIERVAGIEIFIADPKSPWQRPSNENLNAHVRRYVGKGTNLKLFTPQQLDAIAHRINTTPRRSLNWATANDLYTQTVAITG